MQQIFSTVLAIWILLLGLAILGNKGQWFAMKSWAVISHPFRIFWSHYGSYLLTLLVGVIIGVANAPAIHNFLGH